MTLTDRIKDLASTNDLTFAELERMAGIGRGTIRKWDVNIPSADKLLRVANLLHSSMDYLMTGEESLVSGISHEDIELLDLMNQLPHDAKIEFRGEIKGYLKGLAASGSLEEPAEMKQAK